jgi:hypothetical protein
MYPVVLIPSIYFIDSTSGLGLEVTLRSGFKGKDPRKHSNSNRKTEGKIAKDFYSLCKIT